MAPPAVARSRRSASLWWISALRGCFAFLLGVGSLATAVAQPTLVNFIAPAGC